MKCYTFFLFITLLVLNNPVFAERIIFKNGDSLSGKIIKQDEQNIYFKSNFGQELLIPKEKIATPQIQKPEIVTKKINKKAPVEKQQTSFVGSMLEEQLNLKTKGFLRFGGNFQEGNTKTRNVNLQGELRTELDKKNRIILRADYAFGEEDDEISEENYSVTGLYDHFLNDKWFIGSNLQFQVDKEADLDLQTTVGVGIGYQAFKGDNLNLSFDLGPTYLSEEFSNGDREESGALRWALNYDQQVWGKKLELFHNHTILQSLKETTNFQFESRTGASIPITKHFKGVLQVDYDFDNAPAAGSQTDDTTYSVNLGYEW